ARQGRRDREARARRRFDDELASELAHPRPDEVEAESRLGIPPPILRIVHTDAVVDDVHSDRPVDVHEADHHPTGPGVPADIAQSWRSAGARAAMMRRTSRDPWAARSSTCPST